MKDNKQKTETPLERYRKAARQARLKSAHRYEPHKRETFTFEELMAAMDEAMDE